MEAKVNKINSVFTVISFSNEKKPRLIKTEQVVVEGFGQNTIKALRSHYPKITKFVLAGFEINDIFRATIF